MPKLLDRLFDDGTNRVNVICSRAVSAMFLAVVVFVIVPAVVMALGGGQ